MTAKERLAAAEAAHHALMAFEEDSVNGRLSREETKLILEAIDNIDVMLCRARNQVEAEEKAEMHAERPEVECAGCGVNFRVNSEDFRAAPDTPPELIYCDKCNEEARQWCERVEANW